MLVALLGAGPRGRCWEVQATRDPGAVDAPHSRPTPDPSQLPFWLGCRLGASEEGAPGIESCSTGEHEGQETPEATGSILSTTSYRSGAGF